MKDKQKGSLTPRIASSDERQIFSPEEVARLWLYQFGPWNNPLDPSEAPYLPMPMHPFTCANRGDHPEIAGDKGILVPTTRGWICPICDYTQDWAHDFMKVKPEPIANSAAAATELFSTERGEANPNLPEAKP